MQDKMTGSHSSDISKDAYDNLMEEIIARGGPKLYQYFKEQMGHEEEEKKRALFEEQMQQQQAIRQSWMDEHYNNLKQAFDADPEYHELLQQRKMTEEPFKLIVDSLLDYKDKAPAVLKHILRNENLINDLGKAENPRDAKYLLNNIFADATRAPLNQEQQQQQQSQNQSIDKPIKLPNPQLMPELPTAGGIDDEVQDLISRM